MKTEFVWLSDSTPRLEKGHLYRAAEFASELVEMWVQSGRAAWREDVPPNQVTIDLRPQKMNQGSSSKTPNMGV